MPENTAPPPVQEGNATGERIKQVRRSFNLTQKKFAESLGIAQGFLCAIERGKKKPSLALLLAMHHLYGIRIDGTKTRENTGNIPTARTTLQLDEATPGIPLYTSADHINPGESATGPVEYVSLPGVPNRGFAIRYCGDFMAPTIRDGDIVIIDPDEEPSSGKIVLFIGRWEEPYLRRQRSRRGEVYFTADNASYLPFKPDDSIRILGVVTAVWRRINF